MKHSKLASGRRFIGLPLALRKVMNVQNARSFRHVSKGNHNNNQFKFSTG